MAISPSADVFAAYAAHGAGDFGKVFASQKLLGLNHDVVAFVVEGEHAVELLGEHHVTSSTVWADAVAAGAGVWAGRGGGATGRGAGAGAAALDAVAAGLLVIWETAKDFTLAETVFKSSETSFKIESNSSIFTINWSSFSLSALIQATLRSKVLKAHINYLKLAITTRGPLLV
jgi:hypothetical protein